VLNTTAASSASGYAVTGRAAAVHGYRVAAGWAAGILAVAALLSLRRR
jgi:hypothetical protein